MHNPAMSRKQHQQFPAWAIILDVIGTVVVAVGVYAQFTGEIIRTPDPADAHAVSIGLIAAGVLMMAPLVVTVLKNSISSP